MLRKVLASYGVGGARVVRGEKKNAGGPGDGSPPAKPVKGWVFAPPAKTENFSKNFEKYKKIGSNYLEIALRQNKWTKKRLKTTNDR